MPENMENDAIIEENGKKKGSLVDDIFEILESSLITIFIVLMFFTYILHPVNVSGPSMNDTLYDADRVLMCPMAPLSCGDIAIINNDEAFFLDENNKVVSKNIKGTRLDECIIKRVVAVGGQTLEIRPDTHEVLVDGKVIDEPYIKDPVSSGGAFEYPITIPEGYYFVMGDNRTVSADSRDPDVGLISKDQVLGKAILRYKPISEFKFL